MAAALHGLGRARGGAAGGLWWVVVVLLLAGAVASAAQQQQQQQAAPACRGLHRVDVEWWVMLKHPGGYQYSYLDSSSSSSGSGAGAAGSCLRGACWRHGLSMQNPNPVSHTLEVLGGGGSSASTAPTATAAAAAAGVSGRRMAHVVYNDADPGGAEHFDYAHAKGVVAFERVNTTTSSSTSTSSSTRSGGSIVAGFWLVHSAPKFPRAPGSPGWSDLQHGQSVFGQHFACFSLTGHDTFAAVASALLAAGPYVYSSQLPASLAAELPAWQLLVQGAWDTRARAVSAALQTTGGQRLRVFTKSGALNASLTDAVVGPGLGGSMFWETWRRGHDALPSACRGDRGGARASLNVVRVAFPGTRVAWGWARDHSKWGISSSSSNSGRFVCLGDMNRAVQQAHRGGSFVCMQHAGAWQAFHSALAAAEACTWAV